MKKNRITSNSLLNPIAKLLFFFLIIPIIILSEILGLVFNRVNPRLPANFNRIILQTTDHISIAVDYTCKNSKAVLVVHGYLSSSKRSIKKYQQLFQNNSYDIVAINLRNHGLSGISLPISGGYSEKKDVVAVLQWMKQKWDRTFVISTSMGSYASIYALADLNRNYYPEAAVFGSFGNIKRGMVSAFHTDFPIPTTLAVYFVIYKNLRNPEFFSRNIRNDLVLVSREIPIAIAHGSNDTLYPPQIIQSWIRRKIDQKNPKNNVRYWTVVNQKHSELWQDHQYQNNILDFFNESLNSHNV